MRVAIDLPEDVFNALIRKQGTVKEIVEKIVIEAVKGNNGWMKVSLEAEKEALRRKIHQLEEEKERLESLLEESSASMRERVKELQKENEKLKKRLKEIERQKFSPEIDCNFIGIVVKDSVEKAFYDLLKEYETKGFQVQKSFTEKCREVIVAVNKYLESIDEPVRLKMNIQDKGLIVCEPKIIANFLDYYAIHPEKLKSLARLIREIDPEIEVQVVEPDMCKGYILLKSNANESHEVENVRI